MTEIQLWHLQPLILGGRFRLILESIYLWILWLFGIRSNEWEGKWRCHTGNSTPRDCSAPERSWVTSISQSSLMRRSSSFFSYGVSGSKLLVCSTEFFFSFEVLRAVRQSNAALERVRPFVTLSSGEELQCKWKAYDWHTRIHSF